MLLQLGSCYQSEDVFLPTHAVRRRAGVTALFPVNADSDGGLPLDFGVEADAVW
jgi:hypothetical protein